LPRHPFGDIRLLHSVLNLAGGARARLRSGCGVRR
jgi:hypothetical protein